MTSTTVPPAKYNDDIAKQIDTQFTAGYDALRAHVGAKKFTDAKRDAKLGIRKATALVVGGTNEEALEDLLEGFGVTQRLEGAITQIETTRGLSPEQRDILLAKTYGELRDQISGAYFAHVPSPDEGSRDNRESLFDYRVKQLTQRIRA